MKIEIYADRGKSYRWRLRARNGKLVCTSGESFFSKGNASRAAKAFLRNVYKNQHAGFIPVEVL